MPLSPIIAQSVKPEVLERNIARLKGGVKLLTRLEQKHQQVPLEGELCSLHWKQEHGKLGLPALEEKIRKSTEDGEVKAGAASK